MIHVPQILQVYCLVDSHHKAVFTQLLPILVPVYNCCGSEKAIPLKRQWFTIYCNVHRHAKQML